MGRSTLPAIVTLFETVAFRVFWVYVIFPLWNSFRMLIVVYPVSWGVTERNDETVTNAVFPKELVQIPEEYFEESNYPGTLVELEYDTYESMAYPDTG